jgi:hypothetical protein
MAGRGRPKKPKTEPEYPAGKHPNTLKNLKRWPKGQTGNPLGNSKISEAYKQILPLPAPDELLVGKFEHLRGQDPPVTYADLLGWSNVIRAIFHEKSGLSANIEVATRTEGKVPTTTNVNVSGQISHTLTDATRRQRLLDLLGSSSTDDDTVDAVYEDITPSVTQAELQSSASSSTLYPPLSSTLPAHDADLSVDGGGTNADRVIITPSEPNLDLVEPPSLCHQNNDPELKPPSLACQNDISNTAAVGDTTRKVLITQDDSDEADW